MIGIYFFFKDVDSDFSPHFENGCHKSGWNLPSRPWAPKVIKGCQGKFSSWFTLWPDVVFKWRKGERNPQVSSGSINDIRWQNKYLCPINTTRQFRKCMTRPRKVQTITLVFECTNVHTVLVQSLSLSNVEHCWYWIGDHLGRKCGPRFSRPHSGLVM